MRTAIVAVALGFPLCVALAAADANSRAAEEVLAAERQTMDGWLKGDPDPALSLLSPDVTYFHVMTNGRIEGAAVKTLMERFRGTPLFPHYEIAEPKVQASGDIAVLTYHLVRSNQTGSERWNATVVYQRKPEGWRVIHSHFSATNPPPAQAR